MMTPTDREDWIRAMTVMGAVLLASYIIFTLSRAGAIVAEYERNAKEST